MNWFSGSIAEAVTYSQTQKALFCVAILGTDDVSKNLETLLADSEVVSFISDSTKFVCIRLSDGTEEHRQFLQLYTNATTPSIYCITLKGTAIGIISNPSNAAELKGKFEQAWSRHQEVLGQIGQATTMATGTGGSGLAPATASTAPVAGAGASSSSAGAGTVTTATPPAPVQEAPPPLEERIERAKKLAAAKQQKRAAEEAEEQRRREKERREHGKGASDLKRWQEEEETKRLAEERRRDKKADELLKQKLREQIAQDRLDRQMRMNPVETVQSDTPSPAAQVGSPLQSAAAANFSGQARLQFRLPTGATHNHAFDPDTQLQDVRQYLITNAVVPFRDFTISLAFPRRQFTSEDHNSTLRDLGLLPSAALLILPVTSESIVQKAGSAGHGIMGFMTSIFGFMLYPMTLIFSFLQRAFAPAPALPPPQAPRSATAAAAAERATANQGNVLGGKSRETADKSMPSTSKAGKETGKETVKKPKPSDHFGADGNVHRLRNGDDSDSDDEQATWNGNSTQQM